MLFVLPFAQTKIYGPTPPEIFALSIVAVPLLPPKQDTAVLETLAEIATGSTTVNCAEAEDTIPLVSVTVAV